MRVMLLVAVASMLMMPVELKAQSDMYDGRPAFSEGVNLGYYLWRDGNRWHVRWTTKGFMRHFTGSVVADRGELKSLKRIDVESETRVLYPGRAPHVFIGPRGHARVGPGRAPVVVTREQDKIDMDGDNKIVFNARTNNDIDGFDFTADDETSELRFVLEIDGRPTPNLIEVGKNNEKPHALPLVVRLK